MDPDKDQWEVTVIARYAGEEVGRFSTQDNLTLTETLEEAQEVLGFPSDWIDLEE